MKKLLRSRKGVSLMEAVVAMTIIAIVSYTAIMIASMSANVNGDYQLRFRVMSTCESITHCFCYADTTEEFDRALDFYGLNYTSSGEWYAITSGNIRYDANVKDKSIEITAHKKEDNEQLFAYSYTKG